MIKHEHLFYTQARSAINVIALDTWLVIARSKTSDATVATTSDTRAEIAIAKKTRSAATIVKKSDT